MTAYPFLPNDTGLHVIVYGEGARTNAGSIPELRASAPAVRMALSVLCPDAADTALAAWGQQALHTGSLTRFSAYSLRADNFWQELASAVNTIVADVDGDYVLFLHEAIVPEVGLLPALLTALHGNHSLCGVNPLLLAAATAGEARRLVSAGTVTDSAGQLHYLYEGLPLSHALCGKARVFQWAHGGALLVRRGDFLAVGGLVAATDSLLWQDFCLRLRALPQCQKALFATVPAARATQTDRQEPWRTCGLWNSLMQRGKLPPQVVKADYHRHICDDGLDYGMDAWLNEGPQGLDFSSDGTVLAPWWQWRLSPTPRTLLAWLASLPPQEQPKAVQLCREVPASLPHVFAWYVAQAARLADFATAQELPLLAAQVARWQKGQLRFHHGQLRRGMQALLKAGIYTCSLDTAPAVYDAWMELGEASRTAALSGNGEDRACWPEIAVVMPVWNPRPEFLRAALDSVLAQDYARWQLCIADDASTDAAVQAILQEYAARDARIKVVFRKENGHISRATNSALELVSAPWCAFMDHDDLLAPHALGAVARWAAERPELRYIYSDSDKIDASGVRRNPVFKAVFDPYQTGAVHLSAYATSLLRELKGLRVGFEGSQDFDLSQRAAEKLEPRQIAHIPSVLYHWRVHTGSTAGSVACKPYVLEATRRAWDEALQRRGMNGHVEATGVNNQYRPLLDVPPQCKATMVLMGGTQSLHSSLLESLKKLAAQLTLELVWQPLQAGAVPQGAEALPLRQLPFAGPAWGTACMAATRAAQADIVFFLYAGLRPLPQCRPEQLILLAMQPHVSMVGGTIEHGGRLWDAGLYPDVSGLPFPLQRGVESYLLPSTCSGMFVLTRRVLAVSPLCMAVKKADFVQNGGFASGLGPLAVVEYALRLEQNKKYALSCPWGHWALESGGQWEEPLTEAARQRFLEQWGKTVQAHPLRNPQLQAAPDCGWTLHF